MTGSDAASATPRSAHTDRRETDSGIEIKPVYTAADAEASLASLKPVLYGQKIAINADIKVRFSDAGHILGSSIVELWITEGDSISKVVFSGDIGQPMRPLESAYWR